MATTLRWTHSTQEVGTVNLSSSATLDSDSFLKLIHRFGDKIYNFAWRLTGNGPDADDLFQEAFTRAYSHRDRYDPEKPFDAWVCRILHNHFMDNLRRYERRHAVSYDAPMDSEGSAFVDQMKGSDPNPEEELLTQEKSKLLEKALNSLAPEYRTAITLCDIDGRSYQEIADIMDCPIGTIRSRLHQGRLLLRQTYEKLTQGGRPWSSTTTN